MRKQLFVCLLFSFLCGKAQPSLDRIEYFFNTDPGLGSGTAVSFTAASNVSDLNFSPDISSLGAGINHLYVRSRSSNGLWSQTGSQIFFKVLPANVNGNAAINRVEYFFNTDPGFGAATPVSFTAGSNIANLSFSPNTSNLPAGINFLHVRSRDANGKWGQVASQMFFKILPADASGVAAITSVEYFFNSDPGFGAATSVPITDSTDEGNLAFAPSLDNLQQGVNRLYVRSKDANGKWSQVASQVFFKVAPTAITSLAPINRMEYFINTDPGLGNAVPVVFFKADSLTDLSIPVNISGLPAGENFLYIRSMDSSGKWSITARDTINISTPVTGPAIVINSLLLNPEGTTLSGFSQRITAIAKICAGNELRMAFDPSGTYNAGNIFTIELSNATGSFAAPTTIGQVAATQGAAVISRLPRHLPPGTGYKIRIVSSSPAIIGDPGLDDITINDLDLGADTTLYLSCVGDVESLVPLYNTTGLNFMWNTPTPAVVAAGFYELIANDANNCPDTALATIKLEVATWTGSMNSNWHEPGNWNINKVPDIYTHVIVPAGAGNSCVVSAVDANAASVQVRTGATISMLNNRKLMIVQECATLPPN